MSKTKKTKSSQSRETTPFAKKMLSGQSRDRIAELILEHRFANEQEKLKSRELDLADEILEHLIPKKVREIMDQMPNGSFRSIDSFCVQTGNCEKRLRTKTRVTVPYYLRSRAQYGYGSSDYVVLNERGEEKLSAKVDNLKCDSQDLRDRRNTLRAEIMQVLWSVSTPRALVDRWPEIEVFVREACGTADPKTGRAVTTALAVPVHRLNAELALPPK